jgi:hypothetical protein
MRKTRVYKLLVIIVSLSMSTAQAGSDTARTLESATGDLKPTQQIRIQNRDFQMLRGYFVRTTADSLYFGSTPSPDSTAKSISMANIDRMWAHHEHGIGRGLLWGGGVLLLGGLLVTGLGAESTPDAMRLTVLMGGFVVLAGYAFYEGASGSTEKLVYSSYRR